jgi:hypothetical protein
MYMVSRRSSENVSDYLQHSDAATQPRKNSAAQELSHPESEAVCNVKGGVRGGVYWPGRTAAPFLGDGRLTITQDRACANWIRARPTH